MRNSLWINLSEIDKKIRNERFSIMRKNINEDLISKDELDFILASLSSDTEAVNKMTWWAKCNNKEFLINQIMKNKSELGFYNDTQEKVKDNIEMSDDSLEDLWIMFDNLNDDKEDEIWIIRNWMNKMENKFSYERNNEYINKKWLKSNFNKWQLIFDKKIKDLNVADITLNHVLEMIMRDLMQDIIDNTILNNKNYESAEIIKTNQYDDMMCGTDFIVKLKKPNKMQSFMAIDITTAKNKNTLDYKNSKKKNTTLWDFSTHLWQKAEMEKDVWTINKDFAFSILKEYMGKVLHWEEIQIWETLLMAKNIEKKLNRQEIKNIQRQINNSLSDNLAA